MTDFDPEQMGRRTRFLYDMQEMSRVETTLWRCECGHALGHVEQAGRVRILLIHDDAAEVDPPLVIARITGHAMIRCRRCGKWKEWHDTPAGLERLLRRREVLKRLARP